MKHKLSIFVVMISSLMATAALAHQPDCGPPNGVGPPDGAGPPDGVGPPDGAGPPGMAAILHCGCAQAGDRMEYVEILVSSRSRGHLQHVAGSIDSCAADGSDEFRDFVRSGSDCQLGGPVIGDTIVACSDQVVGQECGTEVID